VSSYQWGWAAFGVYFAVLETAALVRAWRVRKRGERDRFTLSSQLWAIFGTTRGVKNTIWTWVRRGALVVALLWLTVHLAWGGQII
jgi:hypothetical protein